METVSPHVQDYAKAVYALESRAGTPVSTNELLRRAWDMYASPHSNVVKVTVARLRRKLGDPPAIETVPHLGYRIPA